MIDTAVILAGGKGLRLMPDTQDKPKAMVPILNRPLIEWIILWLKKYDVKNIVVSVDHKKEVLKEYLGNGEKLGVNISYNDHSGAADTGDAFRSVFKNINLPETFLAMNGDQITDMDIKKFAEHHEKYKPVATIYATPTKIPYGIIQHGDEHTITGFQEKPVMKNIMMNTGIYIFDKSIGEHLPENGPIERTTFKNLAEAGKLKVYFHDGLFTTVNDHKDLDESQKILKHSNINFI
ncbi:hypothetical protein A3H65_04030 [Candidatus Giovannonibacteria bacterium RIFCSPLOWO2_02_FULL_45_14]|uniref:Nucleotidyl transferase domain-containing protein n=1 Tax=Candidatus Giovannonibacteria bacterium RIFCSPLOWO2_12_FULL_44_15 TaxID=1798364 RepID=A0A1F5Y0Y8_9BACT|nr:MAG: hypothetical protein A3C75_03230 [Candidatus Giovannonibacteria bacterium RIFCSPHIGHO2_02_FULL_44_31]OGF76657.1 MAG: hypothetical protein A3E62_03440 [Candidatus Giovannonibacteria bacterium RIFCSPHIGHO2_12_FULL_44_29]OGF91231.1 MAG: hypothetical protein A3H65_04030 [Candidatus Giovannonibacteria bacterium RIFCSPLOWO2_02_FULL_45_14]OGF93743.1 MAG: hypothetical protein A3G54_04300 [Candidatus Giovannonibacteria bacterium RIFCSPLOWO2_12_FULL_44_15]